MSPGAWQARDRSNRGRRGVVGRDSSRSSQVDRALSFVMRYLCTRAWRHEQTAS